MNKEAAKFGAATILVLHPEPLIGVMIEELLVDAGAAKTLLVSDDEQAAAALASVAIDGAVLGINNHNTEILPVANRLREAGIPFIVSGSLTKLPETDGLDEVPVVSVLASPDELAAALASIGLGDRLRSATTSP